MILEERLYVSSDGPSRYKKERLYHVMDHPVITEERLYRVIDHPTTTEERLYHVMNHPVTEEGLLHDHILIIAVTQEKTKQ